MPDFVVSAAVEGDLDEVVLRSIADYVGISVGSVFGRKGKPYLLRMLGGYNNAARFSPWVVLIDLDRNYDCAPTALANWLSDPADMMFLRIAVRAIESWLLADRDRIAALLSVSPQSISSDPDSLGDPKRYLVDIARNSPRSEVRTSLVPRPGSGRSVGISYNTKMIEFVTTGRWRIDYARRSSASLQRTLDRLRNLIEA